MPTEIVRTLYRTGFTAALFPKLGAVSLGLCLFTGCLAMTQAATDEPPTSEITLDDGLPESSMAFLGITPDKWEALARTECEQDPGGSGCPKLFHRAAD